MKMLIYCTKSRYRLFYDYIDNKYRYGLNGKKDKFNALNGKIVAECDFEVEEIEECMEIYYKTKSLSRYDLIKKSCLYTDDIDKYLNGKNGYAIHIKNLNVFDRAKRLGECYLFKGKYYDFDSDGFCEMMEHYESLEKAPQNMQYAYKYTDYRCIKLEKCIIISIRPEWVSKILNGEKTIEVRKKVLRGMLEDDM